MAITKTNFINYSRCPRFVSLDNVLKEKFDSDISYEDYMDEEYESKLSELVGSMYEEAEDGTEEDIINKINPQLEAMMDYYKQVEIESGRISEKIFKGKSIYSLDTKNQECFDFSKNGFKYMCYVDIYNELNKKINIIEVKATTTNKYFKLGGKNKAKEFNSIFLEKNNILYLKDEIEGYDIESEMSLKVYQNQRSKLLNRFDVGKYVYDLAVQRFIIEGEYKETNSLNKLKDIKYYLAILNHRYIYNGLQVDGKNYYDVDDNGNELINFIDLTKVTEEMQNLIISDSQKIEKYLKDLDGSSCKLGDYCERKKTSECKFFSPVCASFIPTKNSSLNYVNNGQGFLTDEGIRLKGLELINEGYINMLDIPVSWIKNTNHTIQRECLEFDKDYVDKEKIKDMLSQIKYPIYHLDFETFPCPIPRFKGETPYIQSPFEFSLHIENEPGKCDKEKDNFVFLAKDNKSDIREEMIQAMLKYMDPNKGTLFAQNVSFEKGRIKELANIFPKYKENLMKLYDRGFDLLWIVRTNSYIYRELGYDDDRAKAFNYYNKYLSGSFSIKKTLPVFSNLKYDDLVIKNGTDAIVQYANYNKMTKEEYNLKYQGLIDYCKQDTWAMVEILQGLRKLVK